MLEKFRVAAAQLAPVFLNLEASTAKACEWIAKAGKEDISVLVFPETWLPGYPLWLHNTPQAAVWNHPHVRQIYQLMVENSPKIDSPAVRQLAEAAADAGITVVMGMQELDGRTLYNTLLYISHQGEILGKHRKLVPTYSERLLWGRGDGSTLTVVDTPVGRLGGLICWEHWMPLARQAIYNKHELLHAAVWPSVGQTHLLASRSYAFEGRCFVISVGSVLHREDLPGGVDLLDSMPGDGPLLTGGSVIIGPDAAVLAGPLQDYEEGLVIAEIDPANAIQENLTLDVSGHYSRPDVFTLIVDETPRENG